jgi:Peptidase family M48
MKIHMRKAVTQSILWLGRYAVLPLAAVGLAVFMIWFVALDRHPWLALAAFPVALPIATAAIALSLGILLPISRGNRGVAVDEGAAPGLWAIWNQFDRTSPRSRRALFIDSLFNASMNEHRRYFGLLRPQLTMTVGLALLIVLDERAMRAVVAHEVAHARHQHTSGGANLNEFIEAVENFFDYVDQKETLTGRLAQVLLGSLLKWVETEYRILSRQNELAADQAAAQHVGPQEMARALLLVHLCGARMKELVFAPLDKELIGAIRSPTPPLQRLVNQLDAIRVLEKVEDASLLSDEPADSTHPPLRARLANLGFAGIPKVETAMTSATESLLSTGAASDLLKRFDGEWRRAATAMVGIY